MTDMTEADIRLDLACKRRDALDRAVEAAKTFADEIEAALGLCPHDGSRLAIEALADGYREDGDQVELRDRIERVRQMVDRADRIADQRLAELNRQRERAA